jgi:hypothetical protein
MTRSTSSADDKWIEKLIRFFQRMPRKKPDARLPDYTGWDQSEEQYQEQQKRWLAQVRERKQKKKADNDEG